jgi:hypothetical protein
VYSRNNSVTVEALCDPLSRATVISKAQEICSDQYRSTRNLSQMERICFKTTSVDSFLHKQALGCPGLASFFSLKYYWFFSPCFCGLYLNNCSSSWYFILSSFYFALLHCSVLSLINVCNKIQIFKYFLRGLVGGGGGVCVTDNTFSQLKSVKTNQHILMWDHSLISWKCILSEHCLQFLMYVHSLVQNF